MRPSILLSKAAGGIYGLLLILFPKEFRDSFGEELRQAFQEGLRAAWERGRSPCLMVFLVRATVDVLMEAPAERLSTRRTPPLRKREGTGYGEPGHGRNGFRAVVSRKGGDKMFGVFQDLRFAVRSFARRPGFTAVSLLTLTLGIGAATSIFSVLNGVLIKPFPYPNADELVVLWNTNPGRGQDEYRIAGRDFLEFQETAESFRGMALLAGATASLTGDDIPPQRIEGASISADLFQILGIRPALGRTFSPEENRGDHNVVILSHALWQGRFGGDPDIIERLITMDGESVQVVGVMPRVSLPTGGMSLGLPGPEEPIYWMPLDYSLDWVSGFRAHVMAVVARLEPGVSLTQAQERMSTIARAMEESRGRSGQGIIVRSLKEQVIGDVRHNLLILMGAVALLLVMACANLANLFLARATARESELAVRTALGAGRKRLMRQLLTEILLLVAVGGAFGLALSTVGTGALLSLAPAGLPRQSEVGIDLSVFFFTTATVLLATAAAGLVPSLRLAGRAPEEGLRSAGRGGSGGRRGSRVNRAVVTAQFGLAAILLVGAGLLVKTLQQLGGVDPGFEGDGILTAQLILPPAQYSEAEEALTFHDELVDRIEAIPGVTDVALGMDHPLQNSWWNAVTLLDQPPFESGESPTGIFRPVSHGYFQTFGIPILEGRGFGPADRMGEAGVMVVNRAFVRKYFPQGHPLGQRVGFTVGQVVWGEKAATTFEIVGVSEDVRFNGLREPTEPAFYIPMGQFPYMAFKVAVRTRGEPESITASLRSAIWELDPELPITEIRSMDSLLAEAMAQDRFNAVLLSVFSIAALILAAAGIYGVLSYLVAQRKAELGIRLALGAEPGSVLGLVVRDGLVLAGTGAAAGLATSLVVAPLLASLLFGVPPRDGSVLAGVTLILGAVALVSALLPAIRAARTSPVEAMKGD
jgi:putative ABC transport system permease protein